MTAKGNEATIVDHLTQTVTVQMIETMNTTAIAEVQWNNTIRIFNDILLGTFIKLFLKHTTYQSYNPFYNLSKV